MPSIFENKEGIPRLRSQTGNTKTAVAEAKNEREARANPPDSKESKKKRAAPMNQERQLVPDTSAETKISKKKKATQESRSIPSTQKSRRRKRGGKTRPDYHQDININNPNPIPEAEHSNSSPTNANATRREAVDDIRPSPVPKQRSTLPPLKSDGPRRDIDGEAIESPDPDVDEYLGENATKKIDLLKPPRKREPYTDEHGAVHVPKVLARLPHVLEKARN